MIGDYPEDEIPERDVTYILSVYLFTSELYDTINT